MLLFAGLLTSQALSWGDKGHQLVAAIAWTRLDHNAKVEIAKILRSGESILTASSGASFIPAKPGKDGMTDAYLEKFVKPKFILAATWPDVTKIQGSEGTRCKSWHYYDMPITTPDDTADHTPNASNAIYAINECVAALNTQQAKAKPNRRREAIFLYFLVHIVGDLQQPLHCSANFTTLADGDDGGNKFYLTPAHKFPDELHLYWDSGPDKKTNLDSRVTGKKIDAVATTWLGDTADLPSSAEWNDIKPMDWVQEGHDLAISDAYTTPPDKSPSDPYKENMAAICKKRVILGGYRLAKILKKIF